MKPVPTPLVRVEERRRMQGALRRSEAYLADSQRMAHTGSWAWDPIADTWSYWSDEMFRIFEFDPGQGLPRVEVSRERIHPDDRGPVTEKAAKTLRDKQEYVNDYRLQFPDGRLKYLHVIGHPVFNDAGEIAEFVGTSIDLTEQKLTEEALRRSEGYLVEAQRLNHTGSWTYDPASERALYWSEEMFRIHGFDPEQGPPTSKEFLKHVHPEDRQNVDDVMRNAAREKTDYQVEHRIIFRDGTIRHIHAIGHPVLNRSGEVVEFVGSATDVTERKRAGEALRRSEAYLAEAQRLTHTGSFAWDPIAHKYLYWSEEMFRIFGFDRQDGIPTNVDVAKRIHPDDLEYVTRSVRQKIGYFVNYRIILPDGTVRQIESTGHPVLNSRGEPVEYVGATMDITARKRAEQERERLRGDIAHVSRVSMLGELAASVSHELKQPITAAITNAEACIRWLKRDQPDVDEALEATSGIMKDAVRANEIIDHLRSLYKKSPPQRELVNVNEIVREMVALLRAEANRYLIVMNSELAPEVPRVTADRVQLQQVFMNLMLNAIEAMRDTGGELTIKTELGREGRLLISVSDTGVGLPAEKADEIFNAFFTTKPEGSGMGLAISRSIVESHGGRLWATPNDTRGARFHIALPAEVAASSPIRQSV